MKKDFNLPLVNVHTHTAMIGFRGLVEDVPLKEWLEKYIWPAEKEKVTPEFVYEETKKAIVEMKRNGIKAFGDMYFFEREVARAAKEMKMKVVIGEGIIDFPTPSAKTPLEALKTTESLLKKYQNDSYVTVAVTPHSIYTVSEENLISAKELARKYNTIFHIHLAETKQEFDECLKKNKTTPVGYLDRLGLLDEKTVLVHCVWVTDDDIDILTKRKAKVVHCPLSNLKLGSGIAPIAKMLEKDICVALGTDGAASSDRLDIWEAGKIAALLQKGTTQDASKLPTKQVIRMMTTNGMRALNIKELDGKSIEEIEKKIEEIGDFNFLYELNVSELRFKS